MSATLTATEARIADIYVDYDLADDRAIRECCMLIANSLPLAKMVFGYATEGLTRDGDRWRDPDLLIVRRLQAAHFAGGHLAQAADIFAFLNGDADA